MASCFLVKKTVNLKTSVQPKHELAEYKKRLLSNAQLPGMNIAYEPGLQASAAEIANRWGLNCGHEEITDSEYVLYLTAERLELRSGGAQYGPVFVDFSAGKTDYRRLHGGGKNQLIAKAVGIKKGKQPTILDATAGFAQDAFVFACLGSTVTLVERSPVIAALLEDGIKRAQSHAEIGTMMRERMHLVHADAINYMDGLQEKMLPDVIFLDPMYPERNASALVKKEMRVFRDIVGKDTDANALLPMAIKKAKNRVVVKRPDYAKWLNDLKPSIEMKSKKHRFDIYFTFND